MAINDKINYENLKYDINRKVAEISTLSPRRFVKYEYLTGKKILSSNQRQIIDQV